MLGAGISEYREWGHCGEGRDVLAAAARYLAAHSPIESARLQTAMVAPSQQPRSRVVEEPEAAIPP